MIPEFMLLAFTFHCAVPGGCPESIGLLANSEEQTCTATFVGETLALTSAHCLPPAQQHVGADCSESIRIHTQRPDAPPVACRTVVALGQSWAPNAISQDYALLETDPHGLATVSVATDLPRTADTYSTYTLTPNLSTRTAVLERKDIQFREHTFRLDVAMTDYSRVAAFIVADGTTTINPGNSGSPIINTATGEIMGVVQETRSADTDFMAHIIATAPLNPGGFAALATCFDMPGRTTLAPGCTIDYSTPEATALLQTAERAGWMTHALQHVDREYSEWLSRCVPSSVQDRFNVSIYAENDGGPLPFMEVVVGMETRAPLLPIRGPLPRFVVNMGLTAHWTVESHTLESIATEPCPNFSGLL